MQTSFHSAVTFSVPRTLNFRNPITALIDPRIRRFHDGFAPPVGGIALHRFQLARDRGRVGILRRVDRGVILPFATQRDQHVAVVLGHLRQHGFAAAPGGIGFTLPLMIACKVLADDVAVSVGPPA